MVHPILIINALTSLLLSYAILSTMTLADQGLGFIEDTLNNPHRPIHSRLVSVRGVWMRFLFASLFALAITLSNHHSAPVFHGAAAFWLSSALGEAGLFKVSPAKMSLRRVS